MNFHEDTWLAVVVTSTMPACGWLRWSCILWFFLGFGVLVIGIPFVLNWFAARSSGISTFLYYLWIGGVNRVELLLRAAVLDLNLHFLFSDWRRLILFWLHMMLQQCFDIYQGQALTRHILHSLFNPLNDCWSFISFRSFLSLIELAMLTFITISLVMFLRYSKYVFILCQAI